MKKSVFSFWLVLLYSITHAQSDSAVNTRAIVQKYFVDTLHSAILNENRTIKVYLPAGYNATNNYPVIYVLDEKWMFEPAVSDVIKLSNSNVIPHCIVVGINSPNRSNDLTPNLNTGAFTETNKKFNEYLTREVPMFIEKKYVPSAFNILVGHSDGATFAQNAMTHNPDAFRGVICLSQNLFGNELDEYMNFSKRNFPKNNYYFVASGTRDATPRIRSGMKLDSLFLINTNPHLKVRHKMYNADHSGVAAMGLTDGIAFIFSDYFQPNGWNRALADSLKGIKMEPAALIETTVAGINANYGVNAKPLREGILDLAFVIITNKEQAKSYLDYCRKHTKTDGQFNASAAQLYEKIGEYDIALEYWNAYLNEPGSYKEHFFYFRRPIELLAYKMNDAKRAIEFAEKWEKAAPPNIQLSFKYFIAKIASDKHVSRRKGKEYIDYFIRNYDAGKTQYTLDEAKSIQGGLGEKK